MQVTGPDPARLLGTVDALVYDLHFWTKGRSKVYTFELAPVFAHVRVAAERVGRVGVELHEANHIHQLDTCLGDLDIRDVAYFIGDGCEFLGWNRGAEPIGSLHLRPGERIRIHADMQTWLLTVQDIRERNAAPVDYPVVDRRGLDWELVTRLFEEDADRDQESGDEPALRHEGHDEGEDTETAGLEYRMDYTYAVQAAEGIHVFKNYMTLPQCPPLGLLHAHIHVASGGLVPPDVGRFVIETAQGTRAFHVHDREQWGQTLVSELGIVPRPYMLGEERLGDIWPLTFLVETQDGLERGRVTVEVYNDALRWEERARRGRP